MESKKRFLTRKTMHGLTKAQQENAWKQHLEATDGAVKSTSGKQRTYVDRLVGNLEYANEYTRMVVNPFDHIVRMPTNDTTRTHCFRTVTALDLPIDDLGNFHVLAARNPFAHVAKRIPISALTAWNLGQYMLKAGALTRSDLDGAVVDDTLMEIDPRPALNTPWVSFAAGASDRGTFTSEPGTFINDDVRVDLMPLTVTPTGVTTANYVPVNAGQTIVTMNFVSLYGTSAYGNYGVSWITTAGAETTTAFTSGTTGSSGYAQMTVPAGAIGIVGVRCLANTSALLYASFEVYYAVSGIAMELCRAISWEPCANWAFFAEVATKWRCTALALLVTQTASNFNQGGSIAIAGNSTQNVPKDTVTNVFNYDDIIRIPNNEEYDGNLDEGAYAFSKPLGPALCERWHQLGNRSPYMDAYISCAGKVPAEEGRSIRVLVCAVWEITSVQQGLSYLPGPVEPEWGTHMRRTIALVKPATSNGGHLDFFKNILGSAMKVARPLVGTGLGLLAGAGSKYSPLAGALQGLIG